MSDVHKTFDGFEDSTVNSSPAVVLDNVSKRFADTSAVDALHLTVPRGRIVSLLGPNGAGKTTTIEMCEGFTQPSSGRIEVLGMNPATEPDKVRQRIGMMLQGGGGYSGATVSEQLNLAAKYYANPHDPEWLIDLVGLRPHSTTTYRRLSGGQQQRLSLALALLPRPELIFLDEPTAGMDAQARRSTWELIEALRRDGVTVVLTTHLLDEAERLSDYIYIMDHGQLQISGTPQELLAQSTGESLTFTTDTALADDMLPSDWSLSSIGHNRYLLHSTPTPELIEQLGTTMAAHKILLRELNVTARSLEDVFLAVTEDVDDRT
ncbi:ABC transporter ATP-binding protein [Corynebacterium pseudodiphtheriticum]|uniref:ABC transporter ATP-binding protein n=1 Tax=Corynebacterium pseudodiphtheriticum TaxID=37637 RepID=UPI00234D4A38|nr:ABC transporter ATP-binding protein [Corynebacterium pseudodiphtheriticum]MDC7112129.1 ABC transporter ATP-binding protein [Corynebacterium pseudodiphtheriticum]